MIQIDVKGIIDNERTKAMMDFWGGGQDVFTVENIRRVLQQHPDENEITLNIDCDGGSVEEGLKIYDELRTSGKTIYTNITGSCHSMAVVLLLSAPAENRSANRNIRALIHRVYFPACDYLSADDCLAIAESCAVEEDAILDIYEERTGIDRNLLAEVMRAEKVHDAKSLKDLNFISKINSYNTNQFFNSFKTMANKEPNALEKFLSKVNAYRAKRNEEVSEVFEYKDAEGNAVFTALIPPQDLAVGTEVTLLSGETSATVILEDGREIVIEDNIITAINEEDIATLEERVAELESMLDDATNLVTDLQTRNEALQTELNNYKGSNYTPKNRKPQIPNVKSKNSGADNRSVADIKAQAREAQAKISNASKITKK